MAPEEPLLSAEVLMRPPGGDLTGSQLVTSETIADLRPDDEAVQTARDYFGERGFVTTELAGLGFSLVGPRSLFEEVFGARLDVDETAGAMTVSIGGEGVELPMERVPTEVARVIQAVTFTPPPDFGPTAP